MIGGKGSKCQALMFEDRFAICMFDYRRVSTLSGVEVGLTAGLIGLKFNQ